jgi:N-hydroxyarylamine O-acetyltransferase
MTDDNAALDLGAYFQRIGYREQPAPDAATLEQLHLAHATSITFENLDVLLGRSIRIDLPSIQAKLIGKRRGGYCFEQNRLFAAALEHIGIRSTFLAARVRYRVHRLLPRTHVLLLLEIEEERWIADVGFGTVGLLKPIPLVADRVHAQGAWSYRLANDEGLWWLQTQQAGEWQSLYSFTLEPQTLPDLEVANYYVSTHPESRFVQALIAQRSTLDTRYLLRNYDLIVDRGGQSAASRLRDDDELLSVLRESFDLPFPEGTRFRFRPD